MRRLPLLPLLLAAGGCALWSRPGPPANAPTESALASAAPPDVCKVSPSSLRRIGPIEAGVTTFGEVLAILGSPPPTTGRQAACWLLGDAGGRFALFAHGHVPDQPIRSLALAEPDPDSAGACGSTQALPTPVAFESGLRPGMVRADVERILGPVTVDEGGSFGRECCGLEQTGMGEKGPVYGFGCSAVLGTFRQGLLSSLLVSKYAPPASQGEGR